MEAFYRDLESKQMDALWRQQGGYPTPDAVTAPYPGHGVGAGPT